MFIRFQGLRLVKKGLLILEGVQQGMILDSETLDCLKKLIHSGRGSTRR